MSCVECESGIAGHLKCPYPQTCYCQHRKTELLPNGTLVPLSPRDYYLDPKNVKEELGRNG